MTQDYSAGFQPLELIECPKPVGYWIIDPTPVNGKPMTQFAVYTKVTEEQIKNTEQLLGWKWEDAE